jgi:hypothetical protein
VTTRQEAALRTVASRLSGAEGARPEERPPFEAIPTERPRARAETQVAPRPAPTEVRQHQRATVSPQYDRGPAEVAAESGGTQVGPAPSRAPAYAPDYDEDAPTRVHDVESIAAQAAELPQRRDATLAAEPSRPSGAEGGPAASRRAAAQWTRPAAPTHEEGREQAAPEQVETRPESELPLRPAHRPAVELPRPAAAAAAESYADELESSGEFDEYTLRKGSVFGTVVVSILLLAALGLVGASLALKNTADPRPLLEDLIRQTVKR